MSRITHERKRELRSIILEHFRDTNDIQSLIDLKEIQERFGTNSKHVRKVLYALANVGLLFPTGEYRARKYTTTSDGRILLEELDD